MRVEIENYRGWDISFDTERETFYAKSVEYDRGETKRSFASAKQFVDDFIKENLQFKPVWVEKVPSQYNNQNKIKLIGIRKDKRFVYEDADGKKNQLSEYSEKDYILCNEENKEFFAQMAECRERINLIENEIKVIESKIIKVGLNQLKARYSI